MKRMTITFTLSVAVGVVAGVFILAFPTQGGVYKLLLPVGLAERFAYIPEDNPLTSDKINLGKQIFWDSRWSTSRTVACVSCHWPDHGWSDPRQFSLDHAGKPTVRHAPTIINRLFSEVQGWPGHRKSLEELVSKLPFTSPETIAQNLRNIQEYQEQFRRVFNTTVTAEGVAKALSAYTRTILSGNAPYDRFKAGDHNALSPEAQRGLTLFEEKARCVRCHTGANFTDEDYHNIGVGMDKENPDLGRYTATKVEADKGAFKTPTLRDVAKRGPYMHDGSIDTLEKVIEYYDKGGNTNPWLSPKSLPLHLTAPERADLIAFLHALTGEIAAEVSSSPQLPQ
jgi:cytochrome c peroxidase